MTDQELAKAFTETVKKELKWGTEFGLNERGLEVEHCRDYSICTVDRYQPSPNPSIRKLRKLVARFIETNKVDKTRVLAWPLRGCFSVQFSKGRFGATKV